MASETDRNGFTENVSVTSTSDGTAVMDNDQADPTLSLTHSTISALREIQPSGLCTWCNQIDLESLIKRTKQTPIDAVGFSRAKIAANQVGNEDMNPSDVIWTVDCRILSLLLVQACQSCHLLDEVLLAEPEGHFRRFDLYQSWWYNEMRELKEKAPLDTRRQEDLRHLESITLRNQSWSLIIDSKKDHDICDEIVSRAASASHGSRGVHRARSTRDDKISYSILDDWVNKCIDDHGGCCKSVWTEELRTIRLIDIPHREVVSASNLDLSDFRYAALSYVWGGAVQPYYPLGKIDQPLCQTIEDACTVASQLGLRYLWVDSVCIDQIDSIHKPAQLKIMDFIFSYAVVTIAALETPRADMGLPRVSRVSRYSQHVYRLGELKITRAFPGLSVVYNKSVWSSRSWCLQEQVLSTRTLLFAEHEVYFNCNGMSCSESMDGLFQMVRDILTTEDYMEHGGLNMSLRDNLFSLEAARESSIKKESQSASTVENSSVTPKIDQSTYFRYYDLMIREYTKRKLSLEDDAVYAFLGIMNRFSKACGIEMPWAMPCAPILFFREYLAWSHNDPIVPTRRSQFPSWSWLGWKGEVTQPLSVIVAKMFPRAPLLPPLSVWIRPDEVPTSSIPLTQSQLLQDLGYAQPGNHDFFVQNFSKSFNLKIQSEHDKEEVTQSWKIRCLTHMQQDYPYSKILLVEGVLLDLVVRAKDPEPKDSALSSSGSSISVSTSPDGDEAAAAPIDFITSLHDGSTPFKLSSASHNREALLRCSRHGLQAQEPSTIVSRDDKSLHGTSVPAPEEGSPAGEESHLSKRLQQMDIRTDSETACASPSTFLMTRVRKVHLPPYDDERESVVDPYDWFVFDLIILEQDPDTQIYYRVGVTELSLVAGCRLGLLDGRGPGYYHLEGNKWHPYEQVAQEVPCVEEGANLRLERFTLG